MNSFSEELRSSTKIRPAKNDLDFNKSQFSTAKSLVVTIFNPVIVL